MDCPKKTRGSEVAVASLPDDALQGILSRLQAKPLFRFKCVSKAWCGLIADRLRYRKFPQTLEGFFNGGTDEKYGDFIELLGRPVPIVDPSFSFLTEVPEIEKIVLLGSCNGLVLFGHRRVSDTYDSLGYIVCNPATEQWVAVPSTGWAPLPPWEDGEDRDDGAAVTYLIFDPAVSPHFQLVQLWFGAGFVLDLQEVYTYSSETGAWRPYGLRPGKGWSHWGIEVIRSSAVCPFNGMLHLSMRDADPSNCQSMIVALDGEGKPSRIIHWPDNCGHIAFLCQSQGHLHCVSVHDKDSAVMTELSIWVLEDYDAEKWILRHNLSFHQLFGMSYCHPCDWDVVAIHPNRGLIFFVQYQNRKLISYDMDRKEVHVLCTLGHGCNLSITPYVPYFSESAVLAKKH